MRQYRGMTKAGKRVYGWYYYNHYVDEHMIFECIDQTTYKIHKVIPKTVSQQVGRKDKNGVEIYNGSEIYFSQSKTQHFKGYVKWSDKELCYLVHCYWEKQDVVLHFCDGYEMKYIYDNSCVKRLDSECFDIVVIGTIHDNPEIENQPAPAATEREIVNNKS